MVVYLFKNLKTRNICPLENSPAYGGGGGGGGKKKKKKRKVFRGDFFKGKWVGEKN